MHVSKLECVFSKRWLSAPSFENRLTKSAAAGKSLMCDFDYPMRLDPTDRLQAFRRNESNIDC